MTYSFHSIKILLVEDNLMMLKLLESVLRSFGVVEITTALNGNDAFYKFCAKNHDLVITDWMMSPCDGIELSKKIRNHLQSPNQYVPIVLMTGFSEKKRVINARDVGVTEFLVKPFNARDLYKRLQQIIERPRQFVRCEDFFGPDRRRKALEGYKGPRRRKSDQESDDNDDNDKEPLNDEENTEVAPTDVDFL